MENKYHAILQLFDPIQLSTQFYRINLLLKKTLNLKYGIFYRHKIELKTQMNDGHFKQIQTFKLTDLLLFHIGQFLYLL